MRNEFLENTNCKLRLLINDDEQGISIESTLNLSGASIMVQHM